MRVCSQPGCPNLIPKAGRCTEHARAHEQARGTRQQRGYGNDHIKLRAQWKPRVEAGLVDCARCHEPIHPTEQWDLGHKDDDRSKYSGPEHANQCNRAAGGRAAHTQ